VYRAGFAAMQVRMVARASVDERMDGLLIKSGEFCSVWSVYFVWGKVRALLPPYVRV
jgi:hypothetical protein